MLSLYGTIFVLQHAAHYLLKNNLEVAVRCLVWEYRIYLFAGYEMYSYNMICNLFWNATAFFVSYFRVIG